MDAELPAAFALSSTEIIDLFESGEYEIEGRMPHSSNATLLVTVTDGEGEQRREQKGIYKPGRGERPLWDFPPDLFKREVATYRVADRLGWQVIPPTALVDGPLGMGSVQAFVDADFQQHYFTMFEDGVGLDDLRQICTLDLITNNTDRKSGHCLLGPDGHVYGIDHGLSFHAQWKLRTVMWDFVDEAIPDSILQCVERFVAVGSYPELDGLLDDFELDAMLTRAKAVLDEGIFPEDETGGHRYPWPLV